jgi:hypothetical protein
VFAAGQAIRLVERPAEPGRVVARARAAVGRRFCLLTANCEHLATEALTGRGTSAQIRDLFPLRRDH